MGGRFEIEVSKTSIGADISWLSQFEGEKEFCYAPLTHLQLVGTPRLEQHNGKTLSIVRLRLTVNQRSKTVEQAERARKDFLKQLASSLEWDVRHWSKRQQLHERLAPEVDAMRAALQTVVEQAVPSELNDNTNFGVWVGRVIDASEAQRRQLAEGVWQDGEAALARGEAGEATALFGKAIDARGRGLCADEKEGRDRVVEMRRVMMRVTGGGGDKKEEADAKLTLANDLNNQGAFDEALELYYQAVELYTQVGHRPVSGGIGWNGEDAALLRSLCGPGRAGSFFVQELWYPRDAYLGRALSRGARVRAVFAAVPAPRSQAPEA